MGKPPSNRISPRPLLEKIAAAQGIGGGLSCVQYERAIGRAFQDTALYLFREAVTNGHNAYPENTKPFYSALRQANYGGTGNVIPDAVADVSLVDLGTGAVKPLPEHFFIEVKAYNAPTHVFGLFGGLNLDTSNGQIQGLLDAAWRGEVGSGILFLTTSDTEINNRVLWWATSHGVTVWQAKAFAVPDPSDPSRYMIGFGPAELQNPSVLGVLEENNILPVPPNPPCPMEPPPTSWGER